ncbi:MAG TPA: nucleotidyltransferase family protein [Candidatus Binatia bacterium]|nr:nucleotidyltransferase family protein [Candidatus Binatia bacterium]
MARRIEPKQPSKYVDQFISKLRQNLPEIRERYGVRSLGIFGSYLRGQQHNRSDLDVLVEFNNGALTLFQFVELRDFLSDLLGVKVDLVEKRALKPAIGKHILEEVVFV